MEAYFDNSATTRCTAHVREIVQRAMELDYGNPSSLHKKGIEAERYVKDAAAAVAQTLKVSEKEIVFTSGGTESDNLAIIGTALANKRAGKRLVTTAVEHAAVYQAMEFLKTVGFEVVYLPVDQNGVVSLEALGEAVDGQTTLVSIMQVNNEIGTVEPIMEAVKVIRGKNPKTYVHVDAVQSYGKMRIRPRQLDIDMMSVSGHKIHGPKGVGFLYVRDKTKIAPISFGGGQQSGMRSGTLNVPGIAGLGVAARESYEEFDKKVLHMRGLRDYFIEKLLPMDGIFINGNAGNAGNAPDMAPHIVSVSVSGVRSEVLLHAFEECGIYVSAGSACSSNKRIASRTLSAIGVSPELSGSTVRFSFSAYNTKEEIDYAVLKLSELAPKLRRYQRH